VGYVRGKSVGECSRADPRCKNETTAYDIVATGSVNLLHYGCFGDSSHDDAAALRSAIGCSNRVFLPSPPWSSIPSSTSGAKPGYLINCPGFGWIGQTVEVHGVGQHGSPRSQLLTHSRQPVFQIGDPSWKYSDGAKVSIRDLAITAVRVGVLVTSTSDVHLTRVAITVKEWAATGPPAVLMPDEDHAALVVVNMYWLYIQGCNFVGATPPDYSTEKTSKRPSVILRGEPGQLCNSVYLVSIKDTVFNMGGVQYQQRDPSFRTLPDAAAGWIRFENVPSPADKSTHLCNFAG
jgi:hypothetical protein